ncbi:MAG: ribosome silencing factor [Armatimonadota bacterium]
MNDFILTGLDSEGKVKVLVEAAEDKKAQDIVTLDLRGRTLIADFFVICTGQSRIHLRAIADGILEKMRDAGVKGARVEGYEQGTWILLDFGDVVAHIFAQQEREFYSLEELWSRMERIE